MLADATLTLVTTSQAPAVKLNNTMITMGISEMTRMTRMMSMVMKMMSITQLVVTTKTTHSISISIMIGQSVKYQQM